MNIRTICCIIEERQQELFALLSDLIKINTENGGSWGNERNLVPYLKTRCEQLGLDTEVYSPLSLPGFTAHPDYMEGRNLEDRPNVSARWKGRTDRDGLQLMGHSDTVPIGDPGNWMEDPLSGSIHDGKIWGRGACDDKYALATVLFLFRILKEQGFVPKENIVFTAYCDEERGGSHGALAASLKYPCEKIVNMDGKGFEIWHAASGGGEWIYRYHTAKTVDSAAPAAAAIPVVMETLAAFGARRKEELQNNRFYRDTIIPGTSLRYIDIHVGNVGADLGVCELMFVYYTDSAKEDICAELAVLEQELEKKLLPLGIIGDGFRPNTRHFHYGFSEPDCDAIRLMQEAAQEVSGRTVIPCGSCLSDLSVILKYGSSEAYGFGIGRNFDEVGGAHQPNEFIECDKLVEYAKIMAAYILKVMGE